MTTLQQIERIKADSSYFLKANPSCTRVEFEIKDIPYNEFKDTVKSFGEDAGDINDYDSGTKFCLVYPYGTIGNLMINLITVPVKVTVTEVVEELT